MTLFHVGTPKVHTKTALHVCNSVHRDHVHNVDPAVIRFVQEVSHTFKVIILQNNLFLSI